MTALVLLQNSSLSMTSRDIAELTGKRHDNVLRDIDALAESLPQEFRCGFRLSAYGTESQPRSYRQYELSRPAAMRLLCKYSEETMAAVLTRLDASLIEELISGFDAQDIHHSQFIYVAVERHSGRYKVGISKDPKERVRQLSRSHPEGLRLVATYAAVDGFLSEREAHAELEGHRLNGEWFSSGAEVRRLSAVLGAKL